MVALGGIIRRGAFCIVINPRGLMPRALMLAAASMRYTLLGWACSSACATCAIHCSHRASSALRRSYAAAPTPTTTACTAGGNPRATAARAVNGDYLFQFFDDDLLFIAAVLLPGTGTAPLAGKVPSRARSDSPSGTWAS